MSSNPETGLPGPAPAPLSAEEAARLLDSIRTTETELAESGATVSVAPSEALASPPVDVLLAVAAALAPDANDSAQDEPIAAPAAAATDAPIAAAEADAAEVDSEVVVADAAEENVPEPVVAAVENDSTALHSAQVEKSAEVESIVAGIEIEPVSDDEPEIAEVEFVILDSDDDEASAATDFDDSKSEVVEPVAERAPATSGLILPGSVADDVETIVHVLRHGEVHNPKGILYGRLPGFQLSVTGRAQAQAVARSLVDHDIALVVASPLQRAQETAEPIAAHHGLIIRTDENLIESGNTFEGLRVSVRDGALRKPRHWWKLRDPFTPSWGEPYLQIAHRMLAAANKARVEAAGREAVLVSHQLPVWTLRRFLQGQRLWHDPRSRQCSLASLTSLVYQGDTLIDIVYSEPAGASDPKVTGA